MSREHISFPCEDIALEGELNLPDGKGPFPAVIVCHPHPLYGGNMENNVVTAIFLALPRHSIAAFRFNFRGVGQSGGAYGNGVAEQKDVRAALDYLTARSDIDGNDIGLAGYSFGAGVALHVSLQDQRMKMLALISPALDLSGLQRLKEYKKPLLVTVGEEDLFVRLDELAQHIMKVTGPKRYEPVPRVDHFWAGDEEELTEIVSPFFADGFRQAA